MYNSIYQFDWFGLGVLNAAIFKNFSLASMRSVSVVGKTGVL